MKFSVHGTGLTLLAILALMLSASLGADRGNARRANLRYTVTELTRLADGDSSSALAINDRRQIAGWSETATGDVHAVVWDRGRITDLGTLPGGTFSQASDINDRGDVVGFSNTPSGDLHAVLWTDGRTVSLGHLGTLPQGNFSTANAINHRGHVVGSTITASGAERAFLWREGRMIDLGTLPGGSASIAWAINDRDQVVGVSTTASEQHAFLWEKGIMTDLGKLPGGSFSSALDINNRREIAGTSDVGGLSDARAFFFTRGEMQQLPGPDGGDSAFARALNEDGRVVGEGRVANGEVHALVWRRSKAHDLGTLSGDLSSRAWDVNQRDMIVGESVTVDFLSRAVMWTPSRNNEDRD